MEEEYKNKRLNAYYKNGFNNSIKPINKNYWWIFTYTQHEKNIFQWSILTNYDFEVKLI